MAKHPEHRIRGVVIGRSGQTNEEIYRGRSQGEEQREEQIERGIKGVGFL